MTVQINLTVAQILGLEFEISGLVDISTGETIRKGLLQQSISGITKYKLTNLLQELNKHSKMFNDIRNGLITKYGEPNEDGTHTISSTIIVDEKEVANPKSIDFQKKIESVLTKEIIIHTERFIVDDLDFKSYENYPAFFNLITKILEIDKEPAK